MQVLIWNRKEKFKSNKEKEMDNMIYSRIAAIQSEIDFIGKDKQVQSGGSYRYRGVDQVLNTLHPYLRSIRFLLFPKCRKF